MTLWGFLSKTHTNTDAPTEPDEARREILWQRIRLEGAARFARLIRSHGGSLDVPEVARRQGVSDQQVEQAIRDRRLLAYCDNGQWQLPVWGLDSSGAALPGLDRVLRALPEDVTGRDAVRFFLSPQDDPRQPSPLALLKQGDEQSIAWAERQASRFMEHTAA